MLRSLRSGPQTARASDRDDRTEAEKRKDYHSGHGGEQREQRGEARFKRKRELGEERKDEGEGEREVERGG